MRALGVTEPVSMRVRVGRNLASFPLPGCEGGEARASLDEDTLVDDCLPRLFFFFFFLFYELQSTPHFSAHAPSLL